MSPVSIVLSTMSISGFTGQSNRLKDDGIMTQDNAHDCTEAIRIFFACSTSERDDF
jgi:hypothetical protein